MSTVTALTPTIIPPPLAKVAEYDRELRSAAKHFKSSVMRIAFYSHRLAAEIGDNWATIGCRNEKAYIGQLGISETTYYKYKRIGQTLGQLGLVDLEKITTANAEALMFVSRKIIMDYPWVTEAKELEPSEFLRLVMQRNKQHDDRPEPEINFTVKVPLSAKRFLDEVLSRFCEENKIQSRGYGLELMVADRHDSPNTTLGIRNAMHRLRYGMWRLERHAGPKKGDIGRQRLREAHSILLDAFKSCRGDQYHEENEKEVYPAEVAAEHEDYLVWLGNLSKQFCRPSGTTITGDESMENSERDLQALSASDELDGEDDSNGFERERAR